MRRTISTALLLAAILVPTVGVPVVGCAGASPEAQSGREYDARGVVRAIDAEHGSITIAHEEVPGYMPAMTMPFELASPDLASRVSVGDHVRFRFRAESGGRHVVVSIERVD